MLELLKELCLLPGVSGDEKPVADYIINKISAIGGVHYTVDCLGSIIVRKEGKNRAKTRLMLSAHMDEVGLIITNIGETGMLKFAPVGGIDPRVVVGRRVKVGKNGVLGVIGTKAVHLQKTEERETAPGFDSLAIDIGVSSREEASLFVNCGDTAVFDSEFVEFGDGFIKAKAIDDRAGCAILLELLKMPLEFDMTFVFTVQEEVGTRGAAAAAFAVAPQAAIVIEATTAADVPFVPDEKKVCFCSQGPVISFMDRHTVYDRGLYRLALETAEKKGIPCQTKRAVAGGNDAGAIHTSRDGVKPIALSLPCRYLHSPSCVIKFEDALNTLRLSAELSQIIAGCELC
jgi:endoglucanase